MADEPKDEPENTDATTGVDPAEPVEDRDTPVFFYPEHGITVRAANIKNADKKLKTELDKRKEQKND